MEISRGQSSLKIDNFSPIWKNTIGLLALIAFGVLQLAAQPTLQFQNFTQKDGLSSNYILSIFQDYQGFMWVGTENGLNRFDGQNFLAFRFDPENQQTIDDNWISTIFEDSQQQLWIGTGRGLNLLNRKTGKIERIPLLQNGQQINALVNSLYETPDGNIWIACPTVGLFKLDKRQNEEKPVALYFGYESSSELNSNDLKIFNIAHATSEELWAVHMFGIDRVNITSKKASRYHYPFPEINYKAEVDLISGLVDQYGKILIGCEERFYILDTTKDKPEIQTTRLEDSESKKVISITRNLIFNDPETLLIPSNRSLALYNTKSGKVGLIKGERQNTEHLFDDPIHAVYKDKLGNYWVGTSGGGLYLGQQVKNAFTFYQHDPSNIYAISKGQVRSFLEEENGDLWVGIIYHGLDHFTLSENGLKKDASIISTALRPNSLPSNQVIKIISGSEKSIWIATNNKGLIKIDSTGKTIGNYTFSPNDSNSLSSNRIWGLLRDKSGNIWAGTWLNGLNKLNPITGEVKRFSHDPMDLNSLGSDEIRYIFINQEGILWIGTNNGLDRYDPNSNEFIHYKYDPNNPNSLSDNLVWVIYEDQEKQLWIGTNTGLNRMDSSTGVFERFYEKDGLPDNSIYGILEDDNGQLWISTKNGLARKLNNQSSPAFLSIGSANGLESTSFIPKAFLNSKKSDQLFFGSAEGMLVVQPSLLQKDSGKVELAIHEMKRLTRNPTSNAIITNHFTPDHNQPIKLGYQDQTITFTLADLNWMEHPSYRYEYQLVGFDQQWRSLDEDMQISFSNLPPGKYTLRARAKTLKNINLDATDLIKLRVFPPWWNNWWAYIAYFIIISSIIFASVRFYFRRQFEKKEAENLRALDKFKNKFFTNITHEFRTPLTIILGMMDQIRKQPDRWLDSGTNLVIKNSNNLLGLINQILELQKLESGNLQLEMQQGDILPFLQNIFEQFKAFAQSKEQRMELAIEGQELYMDFDSEKVLRIVSNLLSNAIKYSPEQGKVVFQISRGLNSNIAPGQCLILKISDNGRGIPKDQLPYIFNRFFQVSSNKKAPKTGSGIGLSLTLELVKLLGGDIQVTSKEGEGTTFTVFLPITQNASPGLITDQVKIQESIFGNAGHKEKPGPKSDDKLPLALIVEDNPDITQYLKICMEDAYRIETAPNGQAGIDKALELIPDIIVSDVMMPEKDGFELCETLKVDIKTSHIPIILLTAKSDVNSRILGLKQGADDYLAKPFHEEELLVRMSNLLNIRRQLQERYRDLYNHPLEKSPEVIPQKEDAFILDLKEIFEEHMDDPQFDLDALSKALLLSRSQLGRKVKALTGQSPAIFLRSLRLQKARQILQNSSLTVKEVAYDVGFSDPAYFSRSYTEEFGESPSKTRDS